jgi:hypothetical protein
MMVALLAAHRLPPDILADVRAACQVLDLQTEEWSGGIPRNHPAVVVDSLNAGERRVNDELLGLLEASPGTRVLICANEPLVKRRIPLADGRVVLLAPPNDRARLLEALRSAIGREPPPVVQASADRRFEVLRRTHWIAWLRGASAPSIALDEQQGATVVIGKHTANTTAVARVMWDENTDARREAALSDLVGLDTAAIHLGEEAAEWLIYWPQPDRPLWICSPHRVPAVWDASSSFANGRRLIRLPAFPGDQVIGGWSASPPPPNMFASLERVVGEGGCETMIALTSIAHRTPILGGVVVEVR